MIQIFKKGQKSIQTGYAVAYTISGYLTKIQGLDILFSFSDEILKKWHSVECIPLSKAKSVFLYSLIISVIKIHVLFPESWPKNALFRNIKEDLSPLSRSAYNVQIVKQFEANSSY